MSIVLLLLACVTTVPVHSAAAPPPVEVDLAAPGPIEFTSVVSGRWAVPLSGLLDLSDPAAAELEDVSHPITLPVHLLDHPEHGLFVIDTGMAEKTVARGLVAYFLKGIEVEASLATILDGRTPAGVLLTHTHSDHVLGLPEVPAGVPIYAGPGEEISRGLNGMLTFGLLKRGLNGRPLTLWPFEDAAALGPIDHGIDVLGDGSLWALHVPGHTPGSTAYLARTTEGPVLFTGDCSHTRWGWEHGVTPGTYTEDHEGNVASLKALATLAADHDMRVEVGHESFR